MTLTVSIGEFRKNLADYLDKLSDGTHLLIKNRKRDKVIAGVIPIKEFDPKSFQKHFVG